MGIIQNKVTTGLNGKVYGDCLTCQDMVSYYPASLLHSVILTELQLTIPQIEYNLTTIHLLSSNILQLIVAHHLWVLLLNHLTTTTTIFLLQQLSKSAVHDDVIQHGGEKKPVLDHGCHVMAPNLIQTKSTNNLLITG